MKDHLYTVPRVPTDQEKRVTLTAVMITLFLSALDQTIVSTAMPRVVAELKGLELYPWVTTIYLLTSTVMVPIWGKLGDLYGRKAIMIGGIGLFVLGSWLCGLSQSMVELIGFRGVQAWDCLEPGELRLKCLSDLVAICRHQGVRLGPGLERPGVQIALVP